PSIEKQFEQPGEEVEQVRSRSNFFDPSRAETPPLELGLRSVAAKVVWSLLEK
ncbi:hypothetical protein TorRG33x02_183380, partial [Trema orientale]